MRIIHDLTFVVSSEPIEGGGVCFGSKGKLSSLISERRRAGSAPEGRAPPRGPGGREGAVFPQGRRSCAAQAAELGAGRSVCAYGLPCRGGCVAASCQEPWAEGPGARALPAAPREQVALDEAQKQKVRRYLIAQIPCFYFSAVVNGLCLWRYGVV